MRIQPRKKSSPKQQLQHSRIGLLTVLQALEGKSLEAEKLLLQLADQADEEQYATSYYLFRTSMHRYGIFQCFENMERRMAQFHGKAVDMMIARAPELFGFVPQPESLEIFRMRHFQIP